MNDLILNRRILACFTVSLFLLSVLLVAVPVKAASVIYGDITLSYSEQYGHFDDVWDLTAGDMVISFTYDATGLVDDLGSPYTDFAQLGVRSVGGPDWNPFGVVWPTIEAPLMAGKNLQVGTVEVQRIGKALRVRYLVTEPGWFITETHLAVEKLLALIPQTKKGNPIPGQFQYSMPHDPATDEYTYVIYPIPNDWLRNTQLYIAAHAALIHVVDGYGTIDRSESAWGDGFDFAGKNWATYFTYTPNYLGDQGVAVGLGVWMATDTDRVIDTFDPGVTPTLDDKLILQKLGTQGEGAYNLPNIPPNPGANHRVWWDRHGVGETAGTGGIYQIEIYLHATGAYQGTAYMKIRGLWQGFETDGNWNTIELTPAGMTFGGDMKHLQVFYGLVGPGAVSFEGITVTQ